MLVDWDVASVEHLARHGTTPEEYEEACRNGRFVTAYPMHAKWRRQYRGEEE